MEDGVFQEPDGTWWSFTFHSAKQLCTDNKPANVIGEYHPLEYIKERFNNEDEFVSIMVTNGITKKHAFDLWAGIVDIEEIDADVLSTVTDISKEGWLKLQVAFNNIHRKNLEEQEKFKIKKK